MQNYDLGYNKDVLPFSKKVRQCLTFLTWSHYFELLKCEDEMEYALEGITCQLFVASY